MSTQEQIRPVFFVGSTSYEVTTPRAAMNYFTQCLQGNGRRKITIPTPGIPGGETSDSHWVDEQLEQFNNISAFRRVKKSTFGETENYLGMPLYVPKWGQTADPAEINLLFKDRARAVHPEFLNMFDGQPGQPRFQVGINVVDLLIFGTWWWAPSQIDAFIEATRRDVEAILERTKGNVLFIIESPTFKIVPNLTRNRPVVLNWYFSVFERIIRLFKEAPWGFHFCDGRLGGDALGDQGFTKKLSLHGRIHSAERTVKASNFLLHRLEDVGLVPAVAHYPFAVGSQPPSLKQEDYMAYEKLYIPEATQFFAGGISSRLSFDEQAMFYRMFDEITGRLAGSGCTCGHGSDDLRTMLACFDRVAHVA